MILLCNRASKYTPRHIYFPSGRNYYYGSAENEKVLISMIKLLSKVQFNELSVISNECDNTIFSLEKFVKELEILSNKLMPPQISDNF